MTRSSLKVLETLKKKGFRHYCQDFFWNHIDIPSKHWEKKELSNTLFLHVSLHKKWSFPLSICSVNVIKFAWNHIEIPSKHWEKKELSNTLFLHVSLHKKWGFPLSISSLKLPGEFTGIKMSRKGNYTITFIFELCITEKVFQNWVEMNTETTRHYTFYV